MPEYCCYVEIEIEIECSLCLQFSGKEFSGDEMECPIRTSHCVQCLVSGVWSLMWVKCKEKSEKGLGKRDCVVLFSMQPKSATTT